MEIKAPGYTDSDCLSPSDEGMEGKKGFQGKETVGVVPLGVGNRIPVLAKVTSPAKMAQHLKIWVFGRIRG